MDGRERGGRVSPVLGAQMTTLQRAQIARIVDRAQAISRGEAPPAVLAAAKAHRHAAHLLHTARSPEAEVTHVLAALNLVHVMETWK